MPRHRRTRSASKTTINVAFLAVLVVAAGATVLYQVASATPAGGGIGNAASGSTAASTKPPTITVAFPPPRGSYNAAGLTRCYPPGNTTPVASHTTATFTIDTVSPPAPAITQAPADPTSTTSATFAFSDAESGVTFLCSLEGGPFGGCTSPVSYSKLSSTTHV